MGKQEVNYVNLDVSENIPVVTGTPVVQQLIEVTAPADLPEGFEFQAEANGQLYMVMVPPGGVKAGQRFTAKAERVPSAQEVISSSPSVKGAWKDGLFSCFRHGVCHAHLCVALWCTPVALAQVMTRMRLTWMGEPGSVQQVAKTFKMVVGIFVLYLLVNQILNIIFYAMYPQFQDAGDYETAETLWAEAPAGAFILHYTRELIEFIFWLYILLATCRVRRNVREQYEIPEDVCAGCEDCCCAFWCQCCTTMQMMRHTADYDNYPAVCCTETGLPLSVGVNNV